jgi:hypothetical protein
MREAILAREMVFLASCVLLRTSFRHEKPKSKLGDAAALASVCIARIDAGE